MTTPPVLQRVQYLTTERGVIPVYASELVEQPDQYLPEEHATWGTLLQRQTQYVQDKASKLFLRGLERMALQNDAIPRFSKISDALMKATGWRLVAVNGLLPDISFFELLSQKIFPVSWWIRKPEQMDYIQEPDIFHDLFGHVPMLFHPQYAEAMVVFGEMGSGDMSGRPDAMTGLARLYWHSIEFGLVKDEGSVKAFGAGLMSSFGEIEHALGADPKRISFDAIKASHTSYRIDAYQPVYFVLSDFDQLVQTLPAFERQMRKG